MKFKLILLFISAVLLDTEGFEELRRKASAPERKEILGKCRGRNRFTQPVVSLSTDCSLFAACQRPFRLPTVQTCAPGTLFDENLRVCRFAERVNCTQLETVDPCKDLPDGYREDPVKSKPSQAAIIRCSGGRTVGGRQCNVCEQFGGSNGCVFIPDCGIRTTPIPDECFNEPDPDDPSKYIHLGVRTRTVKDCANGTTYSAEVCGCITDEPPPARSGLRTLIRG